MSKPKMERYRTTAQHGDLLISQPDYPGLQDDHVVAEFSTYQYERNLYSGRKP